MGFRGLLLKGRSRLNWSLQGFKGLRSPPISTSGRARVLSRALASIQGVLKGSKFSLMALYGSIRDQGFERLSALAASNRVSVRAV